MHTDRCAQAAVTAISRPCTCSLCSHNPTHRKSVADAPVIHRPRISPVLRDLELMGSERARDVPQGFEDMCLLLWVGGKHQHNSAPAFLGYPIAHRSSSSCLNGHTRRVPVESDYPSRWGCVRKVRESKSKIESFHFFTCGRIHAFFPKRNKKRVLLRMTAETLTADSSSRVSRRSMRPGSQGRVMQSGSRPSRNASWNLEHSGLNELEYVL